MCFALMLGMFYGLVPNFSLLAHLVPELGGVENGPTFSGKVVGGMGWGHLCACQRSDLYRHTEFSVLGVPPSSSGSGVRRGRKRAHFFRKSFWGDGMGSPLRLPAQ
eukprot:sb/3477801/